MNLSHDLGTTFSRQGRRLVRCRLFACWALYVWLSYCAARAATFNYTLSATSCPEALNSLFVFMGDPHPIGVNCLGSTWAAGGLPLGEGIAGFGYMIAGMNDFDSVSASVGSFDCGF